MEAFTQLVETAFPRLKGVAYLILRDADRAEDAVQDALVAAWQDLRALRDPDAWDAWLRRLLVRACYRLAKKDRRQAQVGSQVRPDPGNARSADATAGVAEREWIFDELGRIDVEKRSVIVLHYYLDLPMREVAEDPRSPLWDRSVPSPPRARAHACIDARCDRARWQRRTGAAGMNEQQTFERIVSESVSGIGPLAPSAGAIDRTIARANGRRQRPRWLALIKEPPMRRASRLAVGSPTARIATIVVATILLALMLAAAAVVGSQLLVDDGQEAVGNGPIIVNGTAYDPYSGEIGPDPCNCTTDASWSADGQRVAFRRSSRVLVADLAEGSERELAVCTGCDDDHISMAADGGSVAFTDDGDVWLVDVDTGTRTRVTDLGEGRQARSPTLDPDGDRLAFVIDGEPGIWVTDLGGGQPWTLTTDTGPIDADFRFGPFEPAWSPDGLTIAYLREPGLDLQLWLVDVATGKQRQVRDWPGCCMTRWGGPAWSPDGRELAVVATDESFRGGQRSSPWFLWVVAADGSTIRNIGVADPVRPAWRPVPPPEAATPPPDAVAEGSPMPT